MKTQITFPTVILFMALAGGFVLYMLSEPSQTAVPSIPAEHQQEVAELKRQIVVLQAEVNWLTERFTEPQRETVTILGTPSDGESRAGFKPALRMPILTGIPLFLKRIPLKRHL